MKDGTDLSVASDFRELITFNDKQGRVLYSTFGDHYDATSERFSSECSSTTDPSKLRNCRCRNSTCNIAPISASIGCSGPTLGFCSSTPNAEGTKGPTCAQIISQSSCTNTASGAGGLPISCQWNQPSTYAADQTECQHTYLFSGMEVSMDAPDLDNFGRDGVELRKKSKGEMHGQFGVCNTPGYKLQQVFRHWLMILVGFVAGAFMLYIVIIAVVRSLKTSTVQRSGSGTFFNSRNAAQPAPSGQFQSTGQPQPTAQPTNQPPNQPANQPATQPRYAFER